MTTSRFANVTILNETSSEYQGHEFTIAETTSGFYVTCVLDESDSEGWVDGIDTYEGAVETAHQIIDDYERDLQNSLERA